MIEKKDKEIMRGEFRGDFTRDTFDPIKAFSRVLMQQGRVQLDADWNEQISILLHYMRNMACDIGGTHWGPEVGAGFSVEPIDKGTNDFSIGAGHYYVNGILCELEKEINYKSQPNYPLPIELSEFSFEEGKTYLVYLDVWERHISYVEDDDIREVALGGTDTASRAKVVWQVKVIESPAEKKITKSSNYSNFIELLESQNAAYPGTGMMQAKVKDKSKDDKEPCQVSPESRYRGAENQLYRVQIHKPSNLNLMNENKKDGNSGVTFKYSRNNSSINHPIRAQLSKDSTTLALAIEHMGRDDRFSLKPNDWVEIVDDDYTLQNRAENLLQVKSVDHENQQVTLKWQEGQFNSTVDISKRKSPYLRCWDQKTGNEEGIPIANEWVTLENGIQIQFPKPKEENDNVYQTGDYWLIPARSATEGIKWPAAENNEPKIMPPHGVIHHYAPLAIINPSEEIPKPINLRRTLKKIWEYK